MKIKISILALFLISLIVRTFAQTTVQDADIPAVIKKNLNDKFKITGTPDWEKQNEEYTAFFYIGNYKGTATYKEDGTYVKSDEEVDPTIVPDAVRNYIDAHYKSLKIEYARKYEFPNKKENYYYVTTPKTIKGGKKYIPEFSIDIKGKVISETFPPELEQYRIKEKEGENPVAKTTKKDKEEKGAAKEERPVKKTGKAAKTGEEKEEAKTAKKENKKGGKETAKSASSGGSVPSTVTDQFAKKFKQAAKVEWKTTESNYIAGYQFKGAQNYAYYSMEGVYEKNQTVVDPKNLPPTLAKTISSNYPGQKVISAMNTVSSDNQKFYELKIMQKKDNQELITTVFTTQNGQITKEIPPEGEEKEEEAPKLSLNDVPDDVKKTFNLKFAKATEISWAKNDSTYAATFFFKGEKMTAEYEPEGKWSQTTKSVAFAKLPPPIQNYVNTKYKKDKFLSAQFIETSSKEKYYNLEINVEMGKGKTKVYRKSKLKLSPAAKLIEQSYDEE